jgi:hypothetical protein
MWFRVCLCVLYKIVQAVTAALLEVKVGVSDEGSRCKRSGELSVIWKRYSAKINKLGSLSVRLQLGIAQIARQRPSLHSQLIRTTCESL